MAGLELSYTFEPPALRGPSIQRPASAAESAPFTAAAGLDLRGAAP